MRKVGGLTLYTFEEVKDSLFGKMGSPLREEYEHEHQLSLLGYSIVQLGYKKNLTQKNIADLSGVQKSRISKLENNAGDVTFETFFKVLKAMKVKFELYLQINGKKINLLKGNEKKIGGFTVNDLLKAYKLLDKSASIGMRVDGKTLNVA